MTYTVQPGSVTEQALPKRRDWSGILANEEPSIGWKLKTTKVSILSFYNSLILSDTSGIQCITQTALLESSYFKLPKPIEIWTLWPSWLGVPYTWVCVSICINVIFMKVLLAGKFHVTSGELFCISWLKFKHWEVSEMDTVAWLEILFINTLIILWLKEVDEKERRIVF